MLSQPSRKLPDTKQHGESAPCGFAARHFRVAAEASQLRKVRCLTDAAAADFGLDPQDRHGFVFAVNEAVTNAIQHGTPHQDGTIAVRIDASGDTLICSVNDGGPYLPSRGYSGSLEEHGRGLTFMALLADEVELSTESGGTTVRLHKRRRSCDQGGG